MKIPIERLKRDLHAIMYKDVATVYRSVKVIEEGTGATDYEVQTVIENLSCKLSQYMTIDADRNERAQSIDLDFRRCIHKKCDII